MENRKGSDTVNAGPSGQDPREVGEEIVGNVRLKDQDPSPDDRERGETSETDPPSTADR